VTPDGHSLNEGRVILERAKVPGYFRHEEGGPAVDPARPDVKRPGHSLLNIRLALEGAAAPPGFKGPDELNGFDVFAGYMVLDALVANRDRHEQNWAVLTPQLISPPERLSPTYDHASSLGYNVVDAKREAYLGDSSRLRAWAEKGTAYRFEHAGKPPGTGHNSHSRINFELTLGVHQGIALRCIEVRPALLGLACAEGDGVLSFLGGPEDLAPLRHQA
jgi:hypothetical protein